MSSITPWLWFDGQAEEAAEFYVSVFPNARIHDVSRTPPGGPGDEGSVLTVSFELDGQRFGGLNGGPRFAFNEAVSFQVLCDTQEEVDRYWELLTADGGSESMCGWLKDRFGVSWQIVPKRLLELLGDPDPQRAERTMAAMLDMRRLDIAALERAAGEE